jgi:hypothetical protein
MSEPIKVTYGGVEITYLEREDKWRFELRGRERSSESLAKAKEAIDRPDPPEKKPFKRISAWVNKYSGFAKVEVTSIAESSYGHTQVWVTGTGTGWRHGKERSKESASMVYPSPQNDAKVEEWMALSKQIDTLRERQVKLVKEMKPLEVDA